MTLAPHEVTRLLLDWRKGDRAALDRLMPVVYEELHRVAARLMRGEREGHTLQTSALVNEAYLRLADYKNMQWQDRAHFFAVAAQAMRRILVDFARARRNQKRGGGAERVTLEEGLAVTPDGGDDLLALDEALGRLAALHPRQARVVELRYFGGLSEEETAGVLEVSERTVRGDWSIARAWLYKELGRGGGR